MLKDIRKGAKAPAPQEAEDAVDQAVRSLVKEFSDRNPELADQISEQLITKAIVDAALESGAYSVKVGDVEETLTADWNWNKYQPQPRRRGQGSKKGLKKPHTDI